LGILKKKGLLKMSKWYVGMVKGTPSMIAFESDIKPSKSTHGNLGFFLGPFKTKTGAEYAARVGPKISIQGISHYEKLSREEV
jgi:hypothetical protein